MNRVLLKKELLQNGLWFVLLGVLTVVFMGILAIGSKISGTSGGTFFAIGYGLLMFFPIPLSILAYILVATEFRNKTQLFLEALPLPRWRMIAVKWILGLFLALCFAFSTLVILWQVSRGEESLTLNFIGILAIKAGLWATFVFGFFFVMGFMGRYRIPIFLTIFIALVSMANGTFVSLLDFPPFALMDMNRFGFERDVWPVYEIIWTAGLSVGWVVFSFMIGLARDGSVAAKLGQKMSYREKMFIGTAVFGLLLGVSYAASKNTDPEKFDLPGGLSEERNGVSVKISSIDLNRPIDESIALASSMAKSLSASRDWLGILPEDWPILYVAERLDLENEDGELLEPGFIENREGNAVLMYANYRAKDFEIKRLEAAALGEILQSYTYDRVAREDRWWLVCGLQGKWELGSFDPSRVEEEKGAKWEKLAHEAVKQFGLETDDVLGWEAYQEEVTWQSADAVAWMGMCFLKQKVGEEKIQQLAREVLVHRVKRKDSRAVVWDWTHPVPSVFEQVTGLPFDDYVNGWRMYIEADTANTSATNQEGKKES